MLGGVESGFEVDSEILKQLVELGAPAEVITSAMRRAQEDAELEIFEDCLPALNVFQGSSTQWRTAGMNGMVIGLDYLAVQMVMDMQRVPRKSRSSVWADVQILERETLRIMRERAK